MARIFEITLRSPTSSTVYTYKSLAAARRRARNFVGLNPFSPRGGVAQKRSNEDHEVFFSGLSFEELFPTTCELCDAQVNHLYSFPPSYLLICSNCYNRLQK